MLAEERLIEAAVDCRNRAYAPYSGYRVGAAIETDLGKIVAGCNVENLSYGATICAERNAVAGMVAGGLGSTILGLAVASEDGVTPCGICLQVLCEFVADGSVPVLCQAADGSVRRFTFGELMPHAFASDKVGRTEKPSRRV